MAKVTLNTIGSRYGSIDALNDNFTLIETALENTVSRDGTVPNSMLADSDMNGYSIINANIVDAASLTVGGVNYVLQAQAVLDEITALYNSTLALQNVTISTLAPSGGTDGDIWFTVNS